MRAILRGFCAVLFFVVCWLQAGALLAAKQDIVILYTNDVHCAVDDYFGYAGLAEYKKEALSRTPYVILADAGDAAQGAPLGGLSRGEAVIRLMNGVGYDFAVPGNHEFDYGAQRLQELDNQLNCGYYGVNYKKEPEGKRVFPAYKIFQFEDIKVALIGVATPETLHKSNPAQFISPDGGYLYTFAEDDGGARLYREIQQAVDEARRRGANYVILVAHLGNGGVTPAWTSKAVARNTDGVDVIIDGHSHETNGAITVFNKIGAPVFITQTGTKLKNIGQLTITKDNVIKIKLISDYTGRDRATQELIDEEKARYAYVLRKQIGAAAVNLYSSDPRSGARLVRSGASNLGDFAADAYRRVCQTDLALVNGGGLRGELKKGAVFYEDVFTVLPFDNHCMVKAITGQQLKDALEMGARLYPQENGGFLHVSGLSYTVDAATPSSVQLDAKGNFLAVAGKYRIGEIMVQGQPLDLKKYYTVSGTAFLLHNGGDGMTMLKAGRLLKHEALGEQEVVAAYIRDYLRGSIGAEYQNPYGSGRIKIINASADTAQ